ncbi:MFS transporter [Subtercola vilae]|uniref:MFS transporter n=1 Tax=Subtercola vilae TaxID=2056433 RepID=A0A4V4REU8_9MICO|nr:MFS transporter [Subtercola vilae]TIH29494.1 MFS transporter [Subtercola vilae]
MITTTPSAAVKAAAPVSPFRFAPWLLLVVAAGIVSVATAPGQTAGLSIFTDPLISELHVSRTGISVSYLIGTLLGAAAQPLVGRALDRFGVRRVTLVIGVCFAVILVGMSFVTEIFGLTAGFVGVRMAGQGALSLAATTAVARAITHRRGLALGISSAIGSAGISLAPVFLESLVSSVGIHDAWRWEALLVVLITVPLSLVFPRKVALRSPDIPDNTAEVAIIQASWTPREAMRTGMFWVIALSLAASGMLSTGLAFHQIAILGEQGLSPAQAAANFLPQTATGIIATLLVGALIDRWNPRLFVGFSMLSLAGALVLLPTVTPGFSAIVYGLVLGAASGALRGMEAAAYVRYFGTTHIGSIRGIATAISLASTALGPIAFSIGHDMTETFTIPAVIFAAFPLLVAVLAVVTRTPTRAPRESRD